MILESWMLTSRLIYEDADLLAVNKPAGLVCHPTKGDRSSSLIGRLRQYLGPNVKPHLINRLDRETSGVVLVAKSGQAALELRRIWEARSVHKEYRAIVHGHPESPHGIIHAPLGKDELSSVAIKDCARPDGASAQTEYWVERCFIRPEGPFALLRVVPVTGRKHQIRIHLAYWGHAVVGDKLYGADEGLYLAFVHGRLTAGQVQQLLLPNQALHAGEVRLTWRGREISFRADPEPWFTEFLA